MTPLGLHLRELRHSLGITQKDMAEGLGVSPAYLSALEHGKRGKPSWSMLQRITGYLGVIWDDAEKLQELATLSDPKVTIDTSDLSADATELANRLSSKINRMDSEEIRFLLDRLRDQ